MKNVRTFNEFTFIIMYTVPYAYKLYLDGKLGSTTSWIGSKPYFYFSPNHIEKKSSVHYMSGAESSRVYSNIWRVRGVMPPYKDHYNNDLFTFDKPTVLINNKYISEWNGEPRNFILLSDLDTILDTLYNDYTIIYIRSNTKERGYFDDNQPAYEFGDYDLIKSTYPDVVCMNDLLVEHSSIDYNTMQLMLHAKSDKFISVCGGNAVISSCFGGENIIYRAPNVKSDGRRIWGTDSNLKLLSGAKIWGTNDSNEFVSYVNTWV